jgi:four helix bundle suffix protein
MPGSYTKLFTYWFSLIIYDLTVEFCRRWIKSYKLSEQMTGAARSAKQNIVEGSEDMSTSLKTAIKLINIAKGSLEELIADYEDFLRQRQLKQWEKNDARVIQFRGYAARIVRSLSNLRNLRGQRFALPKDQETAANLLLTLGHQAAFLLNRQVQALINKHTREGGFTEKLYRTRRNYQNPQYLK